MECPHCQTQMEIPDLWEFFDCTSCGASLQLENNELRILKPPGKNTTEEQQQDAGGEAQEDQDFSDAASQTAGDENSEAESLPETASPGPLEAGIENEAAAEEEKDENLSQILDFNTPPHQGNHFTYCLEIDEISSQALLDKINHIFKNPRLKTAPPAQAKNSSLIVNNLNAVQMIYVIRRLSPLPVKFFWKQKSTLTK